MNFVFIVLIGIIIIILLWIIIISNKFKKLLIKIKEADSGIDVALSKRYNILTKMVEVVKGYSKYEKETIIEIIKLRKGMTIDEKIEVNEKINNGFDKISAIAETYPELKANENYMVLQKSIVDVEENLQAARRFYNSNVSIYNQSISTFPNRVLANLKNLKEKDFFEASKIERKNVNIYK